jgi:hypothetical protein
MIGYAFSVARLIAVVLLVWALARHPIGYYTVLRFIICAVNGYGAYLAIRSRRIGWAWVFGAIAVLFNPLLSFRMTRHTWVYVDVGVAIFLVASIIWFRNRDLDHKGLR